MKRYITYSALSVITTFATHAAEAPDTLINISNAGRAIVIESPDGVKLKVSGNGDDPDNIVTFASDYNDNTHVATSIKDPTRPLKFFRNTVDGVAVYETKSKWDVITDNVGIGWISAQGAPATANIEMAKSFEISWLDMLAVTYTPRDYHNSLVIGFGMDWRNYKISDGSMRFISTPDGKISFAPFPDDVKAINSRLKVVNIGLNMKWRHQFDSRMPWGGRFGFEIGAIANYTTHASIKSRWENTAGNHVEQVNCDINCRRFTVDFICIARVGDLLGAYIRYSPMKVLTGNAPSFTPLSTGLMFHF